MNWSRSDLASTIEVMESGSRPKGRRINFEMWRICELWAKRTCSWGWRCQSILQIKASTGHGHSSNQLYDAKDISQKRLYLSIRTAHRLGTIGFYKNQNSAPACIRMNILS